MGKRLRERWGCWEARIILKKLFNTRGKFRNSYKRIASSTQKKSVKNNVSKLIMNLNLMAISITVSRTNYITPHQLFKRITTHNNQKLVKVFIEFTYHQKTGKYRLSLTKWAPRKETEQSRSIRRICWLIWKKWKISLFLK